MAAVGKRKHSPKGRVEHCGRIGPVLPEMICRKLQDRFPAAENAYRALLEYQSRPYRIHEGWADSELNPPESDSMLTAPAKWFVRA